MNELAKQDPQVAQLMKLEANRQKQGLELIPSENYVSPSVLQAMGSILTNKYSEGYPLKRYYGGNEFIDKIELLAIKRAKKLFNVEHVNVQPYSGSPANLALTMAVCQPGDTVMGLNLIDGGHLTHGWKVSATGIFFNSVPYHVLSNGRVDFNEVKLLAKKHKPKLIWTGATAYVYQYEFDRFAKIADSVGAYLVADIAHIAGLVATGNHQNPVPYVHLITTTTHKTLRGPRGAMIMVTKKGLEKDAELPSKVDSAVFPGLQGGPHDHTTAAIAVALAEAAKPQFRRYGTQIVKNAHSLATALMNQGFKLVGNTTENHLMLVDLTPFFGPGGGYFAQYALDQAGITLNKNTIPKEPSSPYFPSGIRLGTPALTTRGMKQKEMIRVAGWINEVLTEINHYRLPSDKKDRKTYLAEFRSEVNQNRKIKRIKMEIKQFSRAFPIFAW
ncbi:hypothetical protein A2313_03735 [Candidatus Roizmanbacteria bacterium RIFOXYB2_FULL_41_10]|uniref:Serine hydroxymethyltransferase n=1 Tax=Candidatus Roizmanbacteria bacterium RIFOXYA1_FULL_41_12 TaxID=1802082 RepID=A0A1F7KEK5_9BACT|nr:MAG: hypothetical protein A2209_01935 [Candidatus Roizmanbacteria bacterium RIFOXYA1_FULL_41_12]OGK67097.1 MAG: hypothetical protein A2377_00320 [Candidatus Roizmanbacteria bacterium RIFOXYB1_FULL_41_27]OGK69042.1 MAG: hypothetical protein A2313_03735 [Candidatus Roizmanbacteria bacterium RIFOXYB2_FULL_41_10]OGK70683.1 MAG: hypothetical protein A2403_01145 [Candidatus Roizmanbacteria bacterium RIFOXYC1_FULL_41_16]OGK75750.1 MAG: hypothetical protein A2575_04280 [Candidatus Roizmanbacteria ba